MQVGGAERKVMNIDYRKRRGRRRLISFFDSLCLFVLLSCMCVVLLCLRVIFNAAAASASDREEIFTIYLTYYIIKGDFRSESASLGQLELVFFFWDI